MVSTILHTIKKAVGFIRQGLTWYDYVRTLYWIMKAFHTMPVCWLIANVVFGITTLLLFRKQVLSMVFGSMFLVFMLGYLVDYCFEKSDSLNRMVRLPALPSFQPVFQLG